MSHEIRTPMNGVTGMLELLLEESLTDQQRKRVSVALGSAQALLTIINDILDLSKIEAGKLDLAPEWTDVRGAGGRRHRPAAADGLGQGAARGRQLRARRAGARARRRRPAAPGAAEPRRQRRQVHRPGPRVDCRVVASRATRERVRLQCTVTDTGIGIPADQIPLMFEQFTQLEGAATRRANGTGLGLSICRKLIDLMGGTIHVASQPGRGSKFWFEIDVPFASQERVTAAAAPQEAADVSRARGARVLLVEDNPVNRQFALAVLKSVGAVVTVAVDGSEAVRMAAADAPRPDPDGLPDAGDGRLRGDPPHPRRGHHAPRSSRSPRTRWKATAIAAPPPAWTTTWPSRSGPTRLRAAVAAKARRPAAGRTLESEVGVDAAEITARIGGDAELLADICRLFVTHSPEMLQALRAAAAAGDGAAMASAAHALKGSIGNFTQGRPFEAARSLEKASEAGDVDGARAAVPEPGAGSGKAVPGARRDRDQAGSGVSGRAADPPAHRRRPGSRGRDRGGAPGGAPGPGPGDRPGRFAAPLSRHCTRRRGASRLCPCAGVSRIGRQGH